MIGNGILSFGHTSVPYQNMGHFVHGSSRALPSHVDRYGFLTIRGRTGGVRTDADAGATLASSAAVIELRCMTTRCHRYVETTQEQTSLL